LEVRVLTRMEIIGKKERSYTLTGRKLREHSYAAIFGKASRSGGKGLIGVRESAKQGRRSEKRSR